MGSNINSVDNERDLVINYFNLMISDEFKKTGCEGLMGEIGRTFDADRTYLFEIDREKNVWCNTFEWCKDSIAPEHTKIQDFPYEDGKIWIDEFTKNGSFYVNAEETKNNPFTDAVLISRKVESLIAAPLTLEGDIVGFLGVDNPRRNTESIMLLTVMAITLHKELGNKRQKELLEKERQIQKKLEKVTMTAKRANQAKTAFLSRMSHDVRTPLNGIVGLLNISEKHNEDKKLVDSNRKKALEAADQLTSLIDDILQLSIMDDDKVTLNNVTFKVDDLAKEIYDMMTFRANEAGIILEEKGEDNVQPDRYVVGSPIHIKQIFMNVINNAIKYNKPNGKIFYGRSESVDNDVITYTTVIEDTGLGMSEDFLNHIFEPFTQEHYGARTTYHGTGLGMAIVKTLLDKMGGKIDIQSKLRQGTTVTITLPLKIAKDSDISKTTDITPATLKGKNILIAEDNELNMEIAEAILRDAGATVTKAFNGEEVVHLFQNNPEGTFDLILMDLMMPKMDGYDATYAIRNFYRDDGKTIPIIAVTANAFSEDAKKCREAGMNDHISKPIDVQKLIDSLTHALAQKNVQAYD